MNGKVERKGDNEDGNKDGNGERGTEGVERGMGWQKERQERAGKATGA